MAVHAHSVLLVVGLTIPASVFESWARMSLFKWSLHVCVDHVIAVRCEEHELAHGLVLIT